MPSDVTPDRIADIISEVSETRLAETVQRLADFGTRHTYSHDTSDDRGVHAAARWLHARAADLSRNVQPSLETHALTADDRRLPRDVEIHNVIAEIPGTEPDRDPCYIVAHYDSRTAEAMDADSDAPGADDNASGVAAALEAARVVAMLNTSATVRILLVGAEEQGLHGARAHACALARTGTRVAAVLNNDTVGNCTGADGLARPGEVRVFSEGIPRTLVDAENPTLAAIRAAGAESDSPSRQLARYLVDVANTHELPVRPRLVFRPDRHMRGGDHTPFNEHGWPAVRLTESVEQDQRQHQTVDRAASPPRGDLPEFVDPAYLAGVTRLNLAAILHIACAPPPPAKVRLHLDATSARTRLSWTAIDAHGIRYEIVRRDTTEPTWTGVEDATSRTEADLPLRRDDHVFGVRTLSPYGMRSTVVPAMPVIPR